MTKRNFMGLCSALFCTCAAAAPVLTDVKLWQSQSGADVKFSYVLSGAPAVVTARFVDATTGEYIPDSAAKTFVGAVNKVVQPSANAHEAAWKVREDCPDREFNVKLELTAWSEAEPPLYMLVDLGSGGISYYTSSNTLPVAIGSDASKTTHLIMRRIPQTGTAGFLLGDNSSPESCATVHITRPYYIGIYEFTQGQMHTLFGDSWYPSGFSTLVNTSPGHLGDKKPICNYPNYHVRGYGDWPKNNATAGLTASSSHGLIAKIREKTATGTAFDLPTEAQWEYAARAGTTGRYCQSEGTTKAIVQKYALLNFQNAPSNPQEVGILLPNMWGLYDVQGNVQELTLTYHNSTYWSATDFVNPRGPDKTASGNYVSRGYAYTGWWENISAWGRGNGTDGNNGNTGFRLCYNPTPWEDLSTEE